MAERRYNKEQVDRIIASGEQAPEMGLLPRVAANAAVGIPRALTDTVSLLGMIKPALDTAVMNVGSSLGLTADTDFATEMYGEEGLKQFADYVQSNVASELEKLPPARRTEANIAALSNHYSNSDEARDMLIEASPTLTKYGMKAGNAMNAALGLNRIEEETIVDEAAQLIGSSLIPTGFVGRLAGGAGASAARKAVMRAVELALPGTTGGAGNIAANIAVGGALSQGMRAVTDAPSVFTGDALGPEMGIDYSYDPDNDPESGMNGEQMAAVGSAVGGLAIAAAVMMGKANRGAMKQVMDTVEPISAPMNVKNDAPLEPTLSGGQQFKSEYIDASAPLRDTIINAYNDKWKAPEAREAVADIEAKVTDTAFVNKQTAMKQAIDLGKLPGLDYDTIPLTRVSQMLAQLPEQDIEVFNKGMLAKTLLDQFNTSKVKDEDALRLEKMNIKAGTATDMSKFKAIEKKLATDYTDDTSIRGLMSAKEARELSMMIDQNPQLKQVESAYRQINSDIIEAAVRDGQYSKAVADDLRKMHPNYMMLQEAPEELNGFPKWWDAIKTQFKGQDQPSLYGSVRGPLNARAVSADIKKPLDPIAALQMRIKDHIEYTKNNEAVRTYVNRLKETPDWGKTVREVDRMPIQEFHAKGESDKVKGRNDIFAYTEGGYIHYMEAADKELLRAMQFNAPATLTLMNGMRRAFQHGTTGTFAPVFAPTAALFEDAVARATRQPGRSYGVFDATLRRAFPNSTALSAILDKSGGTMLPMMNTSQLQMAAGVFQQIKYSAIKGVGEGIANSLENGSALGRIIGSTQAGKNLLSAVGEAMVRSYNDSRFGAFVNYGVKQTNLLDDPMEPIRAGYTAADHMLSRAPAPLKFAGRQYKNFLEMIHNSSKYAFFAQNYAALQRKHKGNIPKNEIDKLVSETRSLSGDMTKSVGNSTFSKTLSMFPYGQIAVNSMHHIASASARDPLNVGSRILTGAIMPKVAAVGLISSIPALNEWYWNDIPAWQRFSRIPVIGPDWWIDQAQGNQRPLTVNDIYMMPEAPEMTMISNSVITALRTFGAFDGLGGGNPSVKASFAKELAEGIDGVIGIATPPLIAALAGGAKIDLGNVATSWITGKPVVEPEYADSPHQGFNTSGTDADSEISRSFSNFMISLFGVAIGNVLNSVNVAEQSLDNGDGFMEAMGKAFRYQGLAEERRLAEIPGTREAGAFLFTDGQRRYYAGTQRRERVAETMKQFEPLQKQLSVEKDRSGANAWAKEQGLQEFKRIQDPTLARMAGEINSTLGKGKMNKLGTERSELNKRLAVLDQSREVIDTASYHEKYNDVLREINRVNKEQEGVIDSLDAMLFTRYGIGLDDAFKKIGASLSR